MKKISGVSGVLGAGAVTTAALLGLNSSPKTAQAGLIDVTARDVQSGTQVVFTMDESTTTLINNGTAVSITGPSITLNTTPTTNYNLVSGLAHSNSLGSLVDLSSLDNYVELQMQNGIFINSNTDPVALFESFSTGNNLFSKLWVGDAYYPSVDISYTPSAVPEPGVAALLGLGATGALLLRRRKQPSMAM